MKTISLRELHNNTGKWMDRLVDEEEIAVTKRGVVVGRLVPPRETLKKKMTWGNRRLLPEFEAAMKAGLLKSSGDSSIGISEDRIA